MAVTCVVKLIIYLDIVVTFLFYFYTLDNGPTIFQTFGGFAPSTSLLA